MGTAAVSVALLSIWAAPAGASFHLNMISEVNPGTAGSSYDDAFVELQMYARGQDVLQGHKIRTYDGSGNVEREFTFPNGAADQLLGDSQRTIVIGDSLAPNRDFTFDWNGSIPLLGSSGGVCFEAFDCVAWGGSGFTGTLPSPVGTPGPELPEGVSFTRTIGRGCATLLDTPDDTDNSTADFSQQAPSPRSNATAPTETACAPPPRPKTTIKGGPKGGTRDRTPTFRFRSSLAGSSFRCRIDSRPFKPCTSPTTLGRLGVGPHTFQVKASKAGRSDSTPASRSFRVTRPG